MSDKIDPRHGLLRDKQHPWLNKSVETAQKRVEQRDYMIRRRTLEFDDVMNQQREVVYGYRQEVMDSDTPRTLIFEVIEEIVPKKVAEYLEAVEDEEPDQAGLLNWVNTTFPLGLSAAKAALETRTVAENGAWLVGVVRDAYDKKASMEHAEALRGLERYVILNAVDRLWQEHLYAMDGLREAVYLRAFAQKDPLVEYKNEAFVMFSELMDSSTPGRSEAGTRTQGGETALTIALHTLLRHYRTLKTIDANPEYMLN